jgi:hypothetical protein
LETPPWPPEAFSWPESRADRRERAHSSDVSVDGGPSQGGFLEASVERHATEAAGLDNPVLNTYLMHESYHDYRGPCFKARTPPGAAGDRPAGLTCGRWRARCS